MKQRRAKNFPKDWQPEAIERYRPADIAKGYVRFFEPDVYIEAQEGLIEEVGLGSLRKDNPLEPRVGTLDQFIAPAQNKDWAEAFFGLDIINIVSDLYKSAHRFKQRDERPAFLVRPHKLEGLVEAIFGSYPEDPASAYIRENYRGVFDAKEVDAVPETWIESLNLAPWYRFT